MARIFDAGIDLGIDAGMQTLALRVVYGFRYLPPRGATRISSAGGFPSNKRFRNDDVLSVGSDLGRAHDSASPLPEVVFGGAPPKTALT
jgi:hypothetical protein